MSRTEQNQQHRSARGRAADDVVRRSFAGPVGCAFAIAILLFSTPLPSAHPVPTALFLGAMIARLAPRAVLSLLWRRGHSGPPPYSQWMIVASTFLLSIPTGLFTAFVVREYGFESWNTLFLTVFAMVCAISGATTSAPYRKLGLAFEVTLLLPIVAGCFWSGQPHSLEAGLSMALFLIYVLIHTLRLNTDYWTAVNADLALKARAEELQAARIAADAANQAKSQFLANMSHEIRTPMNGVLGMMDLVLDSKMSDEQRELLGYAHQSAQCLLSLLNDLLDHSKAEAGKLVLEHIDFQVRDTVSEALSNFLAHSGAKGIELASSVAENVPECLRGDPTRVRQILVNLLSNAMKFTESGSIRVSVAMDAVVAGTTVLHFQVADTGPGIPEDRQADIFRAFAQGDTSITRRFGGTGLGLAICRDLVTMMGGRIWVESELGRGSTFHFTAGFAAPSRALRSEQPAGAGTGSAASRSLRILVAEDNLINQKLLTRFLERAGHGFEVAVNGEEAVSLCHKERFDLVLMDVQMPVLDGLEATRRIRAAEGSTETRVPVVGVTAGASIGELEKCVASGMDHCITKPIAIPDLQDVLARVSNNQRLAGV